MMDDYFSNGNRSMMMWIKEMQKDLVFFLKRVDTFSIQRSRWSLTEVMCVASVRNIGLLQMCSDQKVIIGVYVE